METTVTVKITVTYDRLSYLMCSALEGGSNYWISFWDGKIPYRYEKAAGNLTWRKDWTGAIVHDAEADAKYRLTPRHIKRGVLAMAKRYPKHFSDFLTENDDAITGDVFLQCCIFGEVIYG